MPRVTHFIVPRVIPSELPLPALSLSCGRPFLHCLPHGDVDDDASQLVDRGSGQLCRYGAPARVACCRWQADRYDQEY